MSISKVSWTTDLSPHIQEYAIDGITILEEVVPLGCLEVWIESLKSCHEFYHNDAIGSMGERGDYLVTDGPTSLRILPGLSTVYSYCHTLVSGVVGRGVCRSPYERSIVNAKVYKDSGCQGLHFDSQPVSCLLFVSEGSPLEIKTLGGEWRSIEPIPGAIAVFQGRKMEHRVPPGRKGQFRVTIPMNYYFPDDLYRPDGLDDAIYANRNLVDAES